MEIEDLLEEADQLFAQAEVVIVREPLEGLRKFQNGVSYLFQAFLMANLQETQGDIKSLFQKCLQIEPGFEAINEELEYFFMPELAEADSEIVCDAANEVWDFIIGLLPE